MKRVSLLIVSCLLLALLTASPAADAAKPVTQPNILVIYADDLGHGEARNLAAEEPGRVTAMKALMDTLITDGRSTPGRAQTNDVTVRRYPSSPRAKAGKAAK